MSNSPSSPELPPTAMDDQPSPSPAPALTRSSGIPRPVSRLPVPKAAPRTLRPAPSRESLSAAAAATSASASRASSRASNASMGPAAPGRRSNTPATAQPQLRLARSRPSLRHSASTSRLDQASQPLPKRNPEAQRRASGRPSLPNDDPAAPPRRSITNRRTSGMYAPGATAPIPTYRQTMPTRRASPPDLETGPARPGSPFDAEPRRAKPSRPSLAERTKETLAQIPSSPALSRKPSAFFDQEGTTARPRSRASSSASRPGSSHNSDGGSSWRRGSRRGSTSSGADDQQPSQPLFRNVTTPYRAALPSIDGTPSKQLRPRASAHSLRGQAQSARSPSARSPSATLAQGPTSLPSPRGSELERSPSPTKKQPTVPAQPTLSPVGMASKAPLKLKPSSSLFVKKGSSPSPQGPDRPVGAPRKVSRVANKPITPTKMAPPPPSEESEESASASMVRARKSSAALREQIAKARAAARKNAPPMPSAQEGAAPAATVADGFDFGFDSAGPGESDDPFNLRRDDQSQSKMLQQRAAVGRATGRLNIAALELKEIPAEVMNMYDFEAAGASGSWAESVDLTRLVAADNEFETIDDSVFPDVGADALMEDEEGKGNIFGGLEMMDLHGNQLVSLPLGLRQLKLLTSLNLSQNRLPNECLEIISQIPSLRDLKLANNQLDGPLPTCLSNLVGLETLDLHGNKITALPDGTGNLSRLRILNVGENHFESLPFESLAAMPLTELVARSNRLTGTLVEDAVSVLPSLQTLDVSSNQLTRIVAPGRTIGLPALIQLTLSMNRLQGLPDVSSWTSLATLTATENSIAEIPEGFASLDGLRSADLSSNDIRVIPPEISRMDNLSTFRITGNPLRDKKFASISLDGLKEVLAGRLEPPPPYDVGLEQTVDAAPDEIKADVVMPTTQQGGVLMRGVDDDANDGSSDFDHYATPPTSAPQSPTEGRSRAATLSSQTWPVRPGGILDRSGTESSTLHPVVCSRVAAENRITQVHLNRNLFSTLPEGLSFFAATLTALSLAHNQLVGEAYLCEALDLPALRELNLSSNHITSLAPLAGYLRAPTLEKLDVSMNRMASLALGPPGGVVPVQLRHHFPNLTVLLAANNHMAELDPDAIRGLRVVDVANNDIAHLDPRLGLLGGAGGLERLEVMGNRFRVPRFSVVERGTDATLRWLRGRVPAAEMSAWRAGNEGSDDDELD